MTDIARVTSLGHVGISVQDLDRMIGFYTQVLGLTVTDGGGPGARLVFLSADPAREQHEFVLGVAPERRTNLEQVSFTVGSLDDLKELYGTIREHPDCSNVHVINHGIAIGCAFEDPEHNRVEVYWPTGMDYVQPSMQPIDLQLSNQELVRTLEAMPPREGQTPRYYGVDKGKRLAVGVGVNHERPVAAASDQAGLDTSIRP